MVEGITQAVDDELRLQASEFHPVTIFSRLHEGRHCFTSGATRCICRRGVTSSPHGMLDGSQCRIGRRFVEIPPRTELARGRNGQESWCTLDSGGLLDTGRGSSLVQGGRTD